MGEYMWTVTVLLICIVSNSCFVMLMISICCYLIYIVVVEEIISFKNITKTHSTIKCYAVRDFYSQKLFSYMTVDFSSRSSHKIITFHFISLHFP